MRLGLPLMLSLGTLFLHGQCFFEQVASFELPAAPSCLVYDGVGKRILAAGGSGGREYIAAAEPPGWQVVRTALPASPSLAGMLVTPEGVYLNDWRVGALSFIPRGTHDGVHTYVGCFTGAAAVSAGARIACVLSGCDRFPGLYDTGSALRVVALHPSPSVVRGICPLPESEFGEARAVCLSPDGATAYVAAAPSDYGAVTIVSVDVAEARILHQYTDQQKTAWVSPTGLAWAKGGRPVLAVDTRTSSRLLVCRPDLTVAKRFELGQGPTHLAASPDGRRVVVASRGENCLRVLDADALVLHPRFASPVECPRTVAFDSDGKRLFVGGSYEPAVAILEGADVVAPLSATEPLPCVERIVYEVSDNNHKVLWAARPDGSDARQVMRLPPQSRAVGVSPDGTRIAYQSAVENVTELFVYELATKRHRRLTHTHRERGGSRPGMTTAHWLPHGRAIVYEQSMSMYDTRLLLVSATGGESHVLVDNIEDRDMWPVPHPWDPDRILFLFDAGNWTFNREIRLLDRTTTVQWTLLPNDGRTDDTPVWSIDGTRILWTQSGATFDSPGTVWSMCSDGRAPRQLMDPPSLAGAAKRIGAIAPDGRRAACNRVFQGNGNIYLADLRDGSLKPFLVTPNNEAAVDWGLIVLPHGEPVEADQKAGE